MCVSALAIKFPEEDGYLAHARAPDSRTDASRFFCVLCFLTKKLTAQRNFKLPPPRLWLKLWVRLPVAARGDGDAPHSRRLGKQRRQTPDNYEAPPASTEKSGVQSARLAAGNRHVLRRATGTSRGVQSARLAACNRHVFRRATGTSRGVQPARLAACNRHVSRRATGTSQRRAICAVRRI